MHLAAPGTIQFCNYTKEVPSLKRETENNHLPGIGYSIYWLQRVNKHAV
jgi:hypothetical protein